MNNSSSTSKATTIAVFSEGSEIPTHYQVKSVYVHKDINRIPTAYIYIHDGGLSTDNPFKVSESGKFEPGKKIMIKAGQSPDSLATIFEGISVKQSFKVGEQGGMLTIVECKHPAIKLATIRKTAIYKEKKDNEIISSIWGAVSCAKSIQATSTKHESVIQYNTTHWDFMLTRADINGYIVIPEDGKLDIKAPDFGAGECVTVELGKNMIDFHGEVDARTQHKSVTGYSWNHTDQKLVEAKGSPNTPSLAGGWSASTLSQVTNTEPTFFPASSKMPSSFLDKWASAYLTKSALSLIQGKVTFAGDAKIKLGGMLKLAGLSKKFAGKAFIGGVTHIIEEGFWTTEARLGVPNDWYYDLNENVKSPEASGILPPIEGLTIGIVTKIHEDPDGNCRILLKLPLMKQDNNTVWARIIMPYASKDAGIFFMPEIDDEVIVGFLNNDPAAPIIIGSVYSKTAHKPPLQPEDTNPKKTIVTRNKLIMTFDDKDKIITIETPAKNTIILNDKDGKIEILDQNKNKIIMDNKGILVESPKDINIKGDNITIDAKTNIKIKAGSELSEQATNIAIKASAGLEAKGATAKVEGSATAELKAGGSTTVKGGVVMIN